jgi:hypothetical protein
MTCVVPKDIDLYPAHVLLYIVFFIVLPRFTNTIGITMSKLSN